MAALPKQLAKVEKRADRAESRLARLREENEDAIASATRTAMTMGGALAMAYWKGRYPERAEILGLDASLVVGGSLLTAGLMGWAGDQDVIVESLGNGVLATYATSKGFELGTEARQKAA